MSETDWAVLISLLVLSPCMFIMGYLWRMLKEQQEQDDALGGTDE